MTLKQRHWFCFEASNGITGKMFKTCSKLIIKKQNVIDFVLVSGLIANLEQISYLLVLLLLNVNKWRPDGLFGPIPVYRVLQNCCYWNCLKVSDKNSIVEFFLNEVIDSKPSSLQKNVYHVCFPRSFAYPLVQS